MDTSLIAPPTRDILQTLALPSATTLSQLLTSILPFVSSLLGPNTGTGLTPSYLTPNIYLKGLSSIEKGQKFLLES